MDDPVLLAVNTILLQLFTLFSYMNDGLAYAAEALTGRFIGARDPHSLRRCVRRCMAWCMVVAILYVGIYIGWWQDLLHLFIDDKTTDAQLIIDYAGRYIGWVIAIPLIAAMPFVMDGVMVGATQSRIMRDSMLIATLAFMLLRGIFEYLMSRRLQIVYIQAESNK